MPESKKVVIKVDVHDNKGKRKVLKAVSRLSGIESLAMDMKDKKLTVIGDIDPVDVVGKLKKGCYTEGWHTEILSVGPAKEEKDGKKDSKKEGGDKDGQKKGETEIVKIPWEAWYACNPPYMPRPYHVQCVEENPNPCVIS